MIFFGTLGSIPCCIRKISFSNEVIRYLSFSDTVHFTHPIPTYIDALARRDTQKKVMTKKVNGWYFVTTHRLL